MSDSPIGPHSSSPNELRARIEAERRGVPFLVFRNADEKQQIIDLGHKDKISIGRDPGNDLALTWDGKVSRVHALLERVGASEWTLADEGLSQNGSYINGTRLTGRKRIRDGDALRFGGTMIVFSAPVERNTEPTTALASTVPDAATLTETQRKILVALCRPCRDPYGTPATNQEIATEVFLSVDAVKTHLRVLFGKFGIGELAQNKKRAQLVWRAFQTGVINERDLWPPEKAA